MKPYWIVQTEWAAQGRMMQQAEAAQANYKPRPTQPVTAEADVMYFANGEWHSSKPRPFAAVSTPVRAVSQRYKGKTPGPRGPSGRR